MDREMDDIEPAEAESHKAQFIWMGTSVWRHPVSWVITGV